MTRYIDADALDYVVSRLNFEENRGITRADYKLIDSVLSEFPTIDAVPVIRCKDCIRNGAPDCTMEYHYLDSDWRFNDYSWNNENDYCSYGERKER